MTGFLPLHVVKKSLQFEPIWQIDLCLELRNLVAEIAPHASERIVKNRFTYHDPQRGGPVKAGICGISLHEDHVRVHFIHGAFLDDPQRLLQGERQAMRFMRISSFEDAPWNAVRKLIEQSNAFRPTGERHQ